MGPSRPGVPASATSAPCPLPSAARRDKQQAEEQALAAAAELAQEKQQYREEVVMVRGSGLAAT